MGPLLHIININSDSLLSNSSLLFTEISLYSCANIDILLLLLLLSFAFLIWKISLLCISHLCFFSSPLAPHQPSKPPSSSKKHHLLLHKLPQAITMSHRATVRWFSLSDPFLSQVSRFKSDVNHWMLLAWHPSYGATITLRQKPNSSLS